MKQISLMESICGCRADMRWEVPFPACDLPMTKTDWLILRLLFTNPRRKLSEMAVELAVTTRTLNRRIGRMVEKNAFFLDAVLNLKKLSGFGCRLLVYCEDPAMKRAVDGEIMAKIEKLGWSHTASAQYSMLAVHCENTSEADDLSKWVRNLDGVREVRMGIMEEQINVSRWLDEVIERRISGA